MNMESWWYDIDGKTKELGGGGTGCSSYRVMFNNL
jgi:hypothetical protein